MGLRKFFVLSDRVQYALETGAPVVTIESTVFVHGLPLQESRTVAEELLTIIEEEGAVGAILAIADGKIHAGIELDRLFGGEEFEKTAYRDVPATLSRRTCGELTVSSSVFVTHLLGQEVFVTGGIGGVHPPSGGVVDISQDIAVMGKFPVTVVSSGAKSILDVPQTLEALEAVGVEVIGFKTDSFPLFYTAQSEYPIPCSVSSVEEAARIIVTARRIGFPSSFLVANPVPEEFSIKREEIDGLLPEIYEEMNAQGISGKQVTPFILRRLHEKTNGKTVQTNIALLRENARLGARLACAIKQSC